MANPRIEELRKRLEKDPASRLFAQLAEELRKDGQLEDAIKVCRDGLGRHPTYPAARMTLGRALLDSSDVVGARAEFEQVVKGTPDNGLAHRFLGECLEALGEPAAAAERYRTALMFAPGDAESAGRLEALTGGTPTPARPLAVPSRPAPAAARPAPAPARPSPSAAPAPPPPRPAAVAKAASPAPAARPVAPPPPPAPRPAPASAAAPAAPRAAAPAAVAPRPVPRPPTPPPPPALAPPPPPSVAVTAEAEPEPEPEPIKPIPLVAADETFELESAHEAARWAAPPPQTTAAPAAADDALGAEPELASEPPPIKLVEVSDDEGFELERPVESRPTAAAARPAAATVSAPAPIPAAGREERELVPDDEPAAPEPMPAPGTSEAAPPLASATLAELYLQQGARQEAEAVLRQVLAREPENERARELSSAVAEDPKAKRRAALERTIARLERMLGAVQGARP